MWGMGKKRSKLGKFIDKHGYSQENLREASNVGRNTVSKACSDPDYIPSPNIMKKFLKAIREIKPDAKINDFWDM